jgi:hypothetical protein
MGPVGAATHVKLATNMIIAAQVETLAEALALLDRGGIPLERLRQALEHGVASSGVIGMKLPMMLAGDFAPRFSVKNMLKDLQIALRIVEGNGMDLPATAATAGALMGAVQAGWAEDDFASLARHYAYPGSVKEAPGTTLPPGGPGRSGGSALQQGQKKTASKPSKKGFFSLFGRRSEKKGS